MAMTTTFSLLKIILTMTTELSSYSATGLTNERQTFKAKLINNECKDFNFNKTVNYYNKTHITSVA